MPQNQPLDNRSSIPQKQSKPHDSTIANNQDTQIQRLSAISKKFKIIGDIEPGRNRIRIPVNRLNAILKDFEAVGIEASGLVAWIDDLIRSQILGYKEHKYVNRDGSRSVAFDFLRFAIGVKNQKDYQKLRDFGIIKCIYKRGHKRAYTDSYVAVETLKVYDQTITKDTVYTYFHYDKIHRREGEEISENDKKRKALENRNNRLFSTGQGNWGAVVRFLDGLDTNSLSTKKLAKYQADLDILIKIYEHKDTVYDERTGLIKYKKKHKITDTCNRAFCWSRDVNLSKKTRVHFFDLPNFINLDQPGSHLWIFHNHINHINYRCLFLEKYLNDTDGSFRKMVAGYIGVSPSTVKIILLSVLNGAGLNKHGSIFKVLLSDGDDDIDLKDYTDQEIQDSIDIRDYTGQELIEAESKLEKFLDIAEGFLRCVYRWHQSIKDNPVAHQTLPKEILDGLATSSTDFKTIASFHLTGYEQQATLWWAVKVQKALMVPLVNFHDGLTLQGELPDDFLTWGDDVLEIKMIEKDL
jgi:hypothetical protein